MTLKRWRKNNNTITVFRKTIRQNLELIKAWTEFSNNHHYCMKNKKVEETSMFCTRKSMELIVSLDGTSSSSEFLKKIQYREIKMN